MDETSKSQPRTLGRLGWWMGRQQRRERVGAVPVSARLSFDAWNATLTEQDRLKIAVHAFDELCRDPSQSAILCRGYWLTFTDLAIVMGEGVTDERDQDHAPNARGGMGAVR